jgi:aryl-alcohol dehydrogenase-like predicted oxidoreductase
MSSQEGNSPIARVPLGRTGLSVSRLGIGSSYGIGADAIEAAYHEKGVNYFYWGSMRRESFGEGIRRLARRNREDIVVVVQTYTRLAGLMPISLHRALRSLKLEYADILLLGMHNRPPSARLKEAAQKLRDSGQVRFIAVSCHRRSTFRTYMTEGFFDVLMFRYNAAHRGAETEILPLLDIPNKPGTVAYTATRWGQLLDPSKLPREEKTPTASDCYRFVLSQPNVDICLTGPTNMEQLREALASLDRGPMNMEELAWMCRVGDYLHGNSAARTLRIRLLQGGE